MNMRLFRRLLLGAALFTTALLTSPQAQAEDPYCYQSGNCRICCYPGDWCCSMACDPCCDQWLC